MEERLKAFVKLEDILELESSEEYVWRQLRNGFAKKRLKRSNVMSLVLRNGRYDFL